MSGAFYNTVQEPYEIQYTIHLNPICFPKLVNILQTGVEEIKNDGVKDCFSKENPLVSIRKNSALNKWEILEDAMLDKNEIEAEIKSVEKLSEEELEESFWNESEASVQRSIEELDGNSDERSEIVDDKDDEVISRNL